MNPGDPNLALLEAVVAGLGPIVDRLVFVGGCATGLLITDEARPPVRQTTDVDVVAHVSSLLAYYKLEKELRAAGLTPNEEVKCRWDMNGIRVDVMPTDGTILGFSNRWYEKAVNQAMPIVLPSGKQIRLIAPPHFLATKLDAFHDRGKGDFAVSHDIEDIVNVVDGRPELPGEVKGCDGDMREYIEEEFDVLLGTPEFTNNIHWHLGREAAHQARVPILLSRFRKIAGLE